MLQKNISSANHHEQKNKKTNDQIKFSPVIIKRQIKLVLQHSLCQRMLMYWFNFTMKCAGVQIEAFSFLFCTASDAKSTKGGER